MGCCSSTLSQEEENRGTRRNQQQGQSTKSKKVVKQTNTIKRDSLSFNSLYINEKPLPLQPTRSTSDIVITDGCSIFIRLSNNAQDIKIQIPIQPPYLTVKELHHILLSHLPEKNVRVRFIYLGKMLSDQDIIVPSEVDLVPQHKKQTIVQIQREGVIQAMITKAF